MNDASPPIPWRYRLGMWLASHRIFGTAKPGNWLMAREIARLTANLSHVQRNTILRKVTAETLADIEALRKQNEKTH